VTGVVLAVLLLGGMPIAFALIAATLFHALASGDLRLVLSMPQVMFGSLEIYDLAAIPLFVLLGEVMGAGGLTRPIVEATRLWLRWLPNALAYVCLVANLLLAAIMGSATAQIAVMTRVMVPEMERDGYGRPFAAGLTAAAGLLGPVIPPSMPFIIYGVVAQVSIADMFLAGILPGLLMFALFCVVVALTRPRGDAGVTVMTQTGRERWRATLRALPVLTIPLAIVGGITGGFVTPTESAAVSVGIALLLGAFVYRELDATVLAGVLDRTVRTSAAVLFLIVAAKVFGWILAYHNVPQQLAAWMRGLTDDATVFLIITFVVLLLVGTVLDGIAALVVLVPVLLPIATGVYGVDPVHFGVVATVTLVIGLLTPPVGAGLYIAAAVAELDILRVARALAPFLLAACGSVLLVILFPNLVDLR